MTEAKPLETEPKKQGKTTPAPTTKNQDNKNKKKRASTGLGENRFSMLEIMKEASGVQSVLDSSIADMVDKIITDQETLSIVTIPPSIIEKIGGENQEEAVFSIISAYIMANYYVNIFRRLEMTSINPVNAENQLKIISMYNKKEEMTKEAIELTKKVFSEENVYHRAIKTITTIVRNPQLLLWIINHLATTKQGKKLLEKQASTMRDLWGKPLTKTSKKQVKQIETLSKIDGIASVDEYYEVSRVLNDLYIEVLEESVKKGLIDLVLEYFWFIKNQDIDEIAEKTAEKIMQQATNTTIQNILNTYNTNVSILMNNNREEVWELAMSKDKKLLAKKNSNNWETTTIELSGKNKEQIEKIREHLEENYQTTEKQHAITDKKQVIKQIVKNTYLLTPFLILSPKIVATMMTVTRIFLSKYSSTYLLNTNKEKEQVKKIMDKITRNNSPTTSGEKTTPNRGENQCNHENLDHSNTPTNQYQDRNTAEKTHPKTEPLIDIPAHLEPEEDLVKQTLLLAKNVEWARKIMENVWNNNLLTKIIKKNAYEKRHTIQAYAHMKDSYKYSPNNKHGHNQENIDTNQRREENNQEKTGIILPKKKWVPNYYTANGTMNRYAPFLIIKTFEEQKTHSLTTDIPSMVNILMGDSIAYYYSKDKSNAITNAKEIIKNFHTVYKEYIGEQEQRTLGEELNTIVSSYSVTVTNSLYSNTTYKKTRDEQNNKENIEKTMKANNYALSMLTTQLLIETASLTTLTLTFLITYQAIIDYSSAKNYLQLHKNIIEKLEKDPQPDKQLIQYVKKQLEALETSPQNTQDKNQNQGKNTSKNDPSKTNTNTKLTITREQSAKLMQTIVQIANEYEKIIQNNYASVKNIFSQTLTDAYMVTLIRQQATIMAIAETINQIIRQVNKNQEQEHGKNSEKQEKNKKPVNNEKNTKNINENKDKINRETLEAFSMSEVLTKTLIMNKTLETAKTQAIFLKDKAINYETEADYYLRQQVKEWRKQSEQTVKQYLENTLNNPDNKNTQENNNKNNDDKNNNTQNNSNDEFLSIMKTGNLLASLYGDQLETTLIPAKTNTIMERIRETYILLGNTLPLHMTAMRINNNTELLPYATEKTIEILKNTAEKIEKTIETIRTPEEKHSALKELRRTRRLYGAIIKLVRDPINIIPHVSAVILNHVDTGDGMTITTIGAIIENIYKNVFATVKDVIEKNTMLMETTYMAYKPFISIKEQENKNNMQTEIMKEIREMRKKLANKPSHSSIYGTIVYEANKIGLYIMEREDEKTNKEIIETITKIAKIRRKHHTYSRPLFLTTTTPIPFKHSIPVETLPKKTVQTITSILTLFTNTAMIDKKRHRPISLYNHITDLLWILLPEDMKLVTGYLSGKKKEKNKLKTLIYKDITKIEEIRKTLGEELVKELVKQSSKNLKTRSKNISKLFKAFQDPNYDIPENVKQIPNAILTIAFASEEIRLPVLIAIVSIMLAEKEFNEKTTTAIAKRKTMKYMKNNMTKPDPNEVMEELAKQRTNQEEPEVTKYKEKITEIIANIAEHFGHKMGKN